VEVLKEMDQVINPIAIFHSRKRRVLFDFISAPLAHSSSWWKLMMHLWDFTDFLGNIYAAQPMWDKGGRE